MKLIDTHAHLFLDVFEKDFDQVIARAKENNVYKIFMPNIDHLSVEKLLNASQKYPDMLFPLMGLHPGSVDDNFMSYLQIIEYHLRNKKFWGIGEIGLDFYHSDKYKQQQIKAFEYQLELASELNLPVVIHTRNSFDTVLAVVKNFSSKNLSGIFHCFTGSVQQAEQIFELNNFYLGIGGILTFKNSNLSETVQHLPLSRLVLETDSPFLTPVPYRGKRNESSYIIFIARKLAQIKSLPLEQVAQITTENATNLFFNS